MIDVRMIRAWNASRVRRHLNQSYKHASNAIDFLPRGERTDAELRSWAEENTAMVASATHYAIEESRELVLAVSHLLHALHGEPTLDELIHARRNR